LAEISGWHPVKTALSSLFVAYLLLGQSINQSIVVYYRHDKMQANNIIK